MVFQRVATEELELFNGAIQPDPCQGEPAYEEAPADAMATSPKPGVLGNTHQTYKCSRKPWMHPDQQTKQT